MKLQYDVNNKKDIYLLERSKRFIKYPEIFLSNTCKVRVNRDDYLSEDEFTIYNKDKVLPRRLYIYGKKEIYETSNLYLNYWLPIFLKTIQQGHLYKNELEKSNLKFELTIGLPMLFRREAYHHNNWTRENMTEFLSCLFDTQLEETNFQQEDLLESLVA